MPADEDDATRFACAMATRLERLLDPNDPDGRLEFLDGVEELAADMRGRLGLVVSFGEPYAELVLGAGPPHVAVWHQGGFAASPVELDPGVLEELLSALLLATLDAALGR